MIPMRKAKSKKNLKKQDDIQPKEDVHLEMVTRATKHKNVLATGADESALVLPSGPGAIEKTLILDLSRRELKELPSRLCEFVNLNALNLQQNELSSLPSNFGNLQKLSALLLTENNFTDFPKQIASLSNLLVLDMRQNKLQQLSRQVRKLKSVQKLFLEQNQLFSLPEEISRLTTLQVLNVRNNHLGLFPEGVCQLTKLPNLDFYQNNIKSLPASIVNMQGLTNLNLRFNQLSSISPHLAKLTNLKSVDLGNNAISEIPTFFFRIQSLTEIHLDHNTISNLPQKKYRLPALKTLVLKHNKIEALPPSIGGLEGLQTLLLDNNELKDLPEEFRSLTSLETLDIRTNPLGNLRFGAGTWKTIIPSLISLKSLKYGENEAKEVVNSAPEQPPSGATSGEEKMNDLEFDQTGKVQKKKEKASASSIVDMFAAAQAQSEQNKQAAEAPPQKSTLQTPRSKTKKRSPRHREENGRRRRGKSRDQKDDQHKRAASEDGSVEDLMAMVAGLDMDKVKQEKHKDSSRSGRRHTRSARHHREKAVISCSKSKSHIEDQALKDLKSLVQQDLVKKVESKHKKRHRTKTTGDLSSLAAGLDGVDTSWLKGTEPKETKSKRSQTKTKEDWTELFGDVSSLNVDKFDLPVKEKAPPAEPFTGLVRSFGLAEDMNKAGLQRAKKQPLNWKGNKAAGFQQEDQWYLACPFMEDENRALFCIFDGHAGDGASKAATTVVPNVLTKQLKKKKKLKDLSEIFHVTFLQADELLNDYEYEGCTATAVCVWRVGKHRYIQSANVGDSNVYLFRNGTAVMLNTEHKLANPAEKQRIENCGVVINDGQTRLSGLAVTRALGDRFAKYSNSGVIAVPHVSEAVKLEPTDNIMVVASDGLWDVISGQKAMEAIKNEENAEAMAKKLLNIAVKSPKCQDNVSIIVAILN